MQFQQKKTKTTIFKPTIDTKHQKAEQKDNFPLQDIIIMNTNNDILKY